MEAPRPHGGGVIAVEAAMTALGRLGKATFAGVVAAAAAIACLAAFLLMLAAPPAAPALTTCAYNATDDTLRVSLPLALDDAILEAIGGNVVVKRAFGIPVDCTGSATPPASAEHDLRERHESPGQLRLPAGP